MDKIHRKLLILSSPRSATQFITKVLRNAQCKIGHEMIKDDGTCGMFFVVEDCWYPGKHWSAVPENDPEDESRTRRSDYEFEQVWHMVRDPRKVIPSLASPIFAAAIWCWQERHTGISCGLFPKPLRAMKFWLAWNSLIEQNEKIAFRFRIEDVDSQWPEMCDRVGIKCKPIPDAYPRDYGTSGETGPSRIVPLSWAEMEEFDLETAKRVREMAERYGYNIEETL